MTAIEVVTASGDFVRTDWANEPDLFWALRGGGGAFGIVTAIEFNLFPIEEVYAGILWYPVDRAAEVLKVWRAWTDDLPDEMTLCRPDPPVPADSGDPGAGPRTVLRRRRGDLVR